MDIARIIHCSTLGRLEGLPCLDLSSFGQGVGGRLFSSTLAAVLKKCLLEKELTPLLSCSQNLFAFSSPRLPSL